MAGIQSSRALKALDPAMPATFAVAAMANRSRLLGATSSPISAAAAAGGSYGPDMGEHGNSNSSSSSSSSSGDNSRIVIGDYVRVLSGMFKGHLARVKSRNGSHRFDLMIVFQEPEGATTGTGERAKIERRKTSLNPEHLEKLDMTALSEADRIVIVQAEARRLRCKPKEKYAGPALLLHASPSAAAAAALSAQAQLSAAGLAAARAASPPSSATLKKMSSGKRARDAEGSDDGDQGDGDESRNNMYWATTVGLPVIWYGDVSKVRGKP